MAYFHPDKINRQEKMLENSLRIERALNYAKRFYQNTGEIMKEENFKDVFLAEEIKEDLDYVRGMKEGYRENDGEQEKEAKKMATILEVIMFDQIERSEWLGEEAITKRASEFDDIKNGVDLIVQFPESKINLAIDVTFSKEVGGKIKRIGRNIENGKLTTVKYFELKELDDKGEKKDVPRVIIGMDYRGIDNLIELWMSRDNDALANSPIQFLILDQILKQLENYKEYAKELKKDYIVKKYEEVILILEKVADEKQELRNKVMLKEASKMKIDKVDEAIRKQSKSSLHSVLRTR